MEEFGDWIYILAIAVAGIASLISSVRKKAQQAANQNQPRENQPRENPREISSEMTIPGSDEDDFWDDYIPRREPVPVNQPVKQPVYQPVSQPVNQPAKQPVYQPLPKQSVYQPLSKPQKQPFFPSVEKPYFSTISGGQPDFQPDFQPDSDTPEMAIIEVEQIPITIDILPSTTDDWRKAFIYNEIFGRKH